MASFLPLAGDCSIHSSHTDTLRNATYPFWFQLPILVNSQVVIVTVSHGTRLTHLAGLQKVPEVAIVKPGVVVQKNSLGGKNFFCPREDCLTSWRPSPL